MIIGQSAKEKHFSGPVFHHLDWLSKRLHFKCVLFKCFIKMAPLMKELSVILCARRRATQSESRSTDHGTDWSDSYRKRYSRSINSNSGRSVRTCWQEADLAAFAFYVSLERSDAVEHAGFFAGDVNSLLTKYPTAQVSWTAVCQPYTLQVRFILNFCDLSI